MPAPGWFRPTSGAGGKGCTGAAEGTLAAQGALLPSAGIAAKDAAFEFIHQRLRAGETTTELEVQALVERVIADHGLVNDHPAIVGFAGHAGDPHYAPTESSNRTLELEDPKLRERIQNIVTKFFAGVNP